jgi:hypothetical protein
LFVTGGKTTKQYSCLLLAAVTQPVEFRRFKLVSVTKYLLISCLLLLLPLLGSAIASVYYCAVVFPQQVCNLTAKT